MKENKIKILYVDDEENNLFSFAANFRKRYEIFTASSAYHGKKILSQHEIHIIITDERMPEVSGIQFLESIKEEFPLPIRIVLTAFADIEIVMQAINKGQVYRYLMKPLNPSEIKLAVEGAYELYKFRKSTEENFAKYKDFFESSNDAILIIDSDGKIEEINIPGRSLLRLSENDIVSKNIFQFFNDRTEKDIITAMLTDNRTVIDYPVKFQNSRSAIIYTLFSATSSVFKNGKRGFQCLIRDITTQKELENMVIRTIIETQENERLRFSKNLHDGIGQKLSAVKLFLKQLSLINPELKVNELFNKSYEEINTTIIDLRNICFNIMPKTLDILGLSVAIKELCGQYSIERVLGFRIDVSETFPRLHAELELAIFRIIQEFISNSIDHGKSTKITISLEENYQNVIVILSDNGVGFDVNNINIKGNGIKNIRSRIQSFNGEIKMISESSTGTRFFIKLPRIPQLKKADLN
jgi:PAS domain S-box-containing protein